MRWIFKQWQDGDTNVEKTLSIESDIVLTAYYEEAELPPTPPIAIMPIVTGAGIGYLIAREPGAIVGALAGTSISFLTHQTFRQRRATIELFRRKKYINR